MRKSPNFIVFISVQPAHRSEFDILNFVSVQLNPERGSERSLTQRTRPLEGSFFHLPPIHFIFRIVGLRKIKNNSSFLTPMRQQMANLPVEPFFLMFC